MQKYITALFLFLLVLLTHYSASAGEVELFIPNDQVEELLLQEQTAEQIEYQRRFNSFKNSVTLPPIHENEFNNETTTKSSVDSDGIVITETNQELKPLEFVNNNSNSTADPKTIITDTAYIHENTLTEITSPIIIAQKKQDITIHENSVEFSNFIVHENMVKLKITPSIAEKIPNKDTVWTSAAAQATLLFSNSSAKERDQAIKQLITGGDWLNVAKKLLQATDNKVRINGINIIKAAVETPKYSDNALIIQIKDLSPLLISVLNDSDSRVRFIAALVLSKLTGNNFNYNFNADPDTRAIAVTTWNNYIKSTYGS